MRAATLAVIAAIHLILAFAVWRAKPDNRVNRFFALHTLTFVGWTLGIAWVQSGIWVQAGSNLTFASASLIPPTLLMFTIHYPEAKQSWWNAPLLVALVGGGVFAVTSLTTELIVYDVTAKSRQAGILYPWFTAYFVVVLAAGLAVFVRKWRSARGRERTQLNYYGVGLLVVAIGGMTSNLIIPAVTGSSRLSHLGPYFGLVLVTLTAHATVRHRFMDLRVVFHRGLTIAIAMMLSLIPVVLILLLFRRSVLSHYMFPEALLTAGAIFAVALLIPLTGDVAERVIDRYIYRARTTPQRLLRTASTELTRALDLEEVLSVIGDTIQATAEPEGIAIYLQRGDSLRLAATTVRESRGIFVAAPEPAAPVLNEAISRATPLVQDELDRSKDEILRNALNSAGWALVLPLFADQTIVGLIAVAQKRSGDPFFSEDVDAFATLANHAGSAVRNAALYAQVVLSNEYVNHIVTAMQNGVVAVDLSGAVTLINPAAQQLLGLTGDGSLKIDNLPTPLRSIVDDVLQHDRETVTREVNVPEDEAPLRLLLCTASRLHNHTGGRTGAVVVFNDLTPLKELEKQRARAETLANLQRVTQTLAHEIGNPLVPIKTLTKLLPDRVGDRVFADNVSRIVSREIERIERLVERLRRVAPTSEVTHSVVDLRVPIQHALEVVEAAAAEEQTELQAHLPSQAVPIMGDSAELEELFLNLLTNALEAVGAQPAGGRSVQVYVRGTAGTAIAHVADTGPGIPRERLETIFDPFVTTKSRGSGLGLAIARGIAERHRGHLTAMNQEPNGAVFLVTIPMAPEAVRDQTSTSPRPL